MTGDDRATPHEGTRAVVESDLDDLERRLEQERKDYRRHLLWIVLGASPGALLPMLFVVTEFGGPALVALILTVMVLEGWRALDTKREIGRMETMKMALRERLSELDLLAAGASEADEGSEIETRP